MIEASTILKGNAFQVEPEYAERLEELLALCRKNLRSVDEELIRKAFRVSYWAHRNDRRASGELYIAHPLAVARIYVDQIGFDDIGVAAALLHDVVEDTELSLEFIRETFDEKIALIIDGLTKISGAFESRDISKAENVRKLMLSMASDIRVIFVKFADRLHNMQTLDSLAPHKRFRIASETLNLFAPLAHRFGFNALKSELEDLCLSAIHPEEFQEITSELRDTQRERDAYVARFIEPLKARLLDEGISFEMYGRSKNLHSIYRKMKRQDKPLSEIYDIFAIRIILEGEGTKGKEDCWRVYSIITDLYKPMTERFRDFLSVPKSNGYQSLHTTVFGPEGRRMEVQIRTREMHEIAEKGVAAHWKYKEDIKSDDQEMDRLLTWVRDLLEDPESESAAEFVTDFRLNLYDEEIYIFTPRGDLFTLPSGATPVDFAYLVHTQVGFHCIGAKVNGKMVPLSYKLKSGDQVEIITSKKQTPNPDWIKFVVTQKARSRIRHWINEKRRQAQVLGKESWDKRSARAGLSVTENELARLASKLKFPNLQQMYFEIGSGLYDVNDLVKYVRSSLKEGETTKENEETLRLQYETFLDSAQSTGKPALLIDGELHSDIVTDYATCCNPIPGDSVFGFLSRTGVIKVHRVSCRNAPNLILNRADRIIPVEWSRQKDVQFVAALRVMGEDRVGILSDLTQVVSKNLKTNIRSITISTDDGVFEGNLVLFVSDLEHLRRLIDRIKRIGGIHGVYRFEEQSDES
ncbi:MAG: bifunctional (p)ppGpp synthetase/guanosine-3',5'-bis(diphosphate) 3'-pyrophosphohydrolase [Bacteroidetes bacterium]|nr:bifunctional (p)ppGpp synthetase/guanosine-3',5'-bis(diphosphate) 3'-pyrophosphohydrolase [Bacteroidota bacterium]